jgi:hypothetical protein
MRKKKAVNQCIYIETILEELGKNTENMEQNKRRSSRVCGFIPAKYKVAGLPTGRQRSDYTLQAYICNVNLDS